MKKYFLLYKVLLLSLPGLAQMTISSGTQWVSSGNVSINIQDMNLVNNGTFTPGNSIVKFSGSTGNTIEGSSTSAFYKLEIDKTGNNTLSLLSHINVNNQVNFISGLIDLNQKNITLASTAILNNETETSRIIGAAGGEVIISMNMNKPNNVNAGNLGAILSTTSNMGTVVIKRSHKNQTGNGLTSSITRSFDIQATGKKLKATTLRFKYFDGELNAQNENSLEFYQSDDNGANWDNISFTSRDAAANWAEKTGLTSFGLFTLSSNGGVPPIANKSANPISEKSMPAAAKKMSIGPNPNNGNFWVMINGLEKETTASLFTIDGKLVKQFKVVNQQQLQVNGLGNGIYILKVPGMEAFKIVVQGSSSNSMNLTTPVSPLFKN